MPATGVDNAISKELTKLLRTLEALPTDEARALVQSLAQIYLAADDDRARAQLAAIVDSASDAIISKNLDGIIQTWNRGAERIFGYRADEVVGRPITVLIPDDRKHEETRILTAVARGQRIEFYETVRRRKDGTLIHISVAISPIIDSHGRVIGASKIARDITEQKQIEESFNASSARYRALFETTLDGILIVDDTGNYLDVNDAYCRLLKLPRERLIGANFADMMPPESLDRAAAAFEDLKTRGTFYGEFPLRAGDGSYVDLEWTSRANFLPGIHMCVARDVTARKNIERKLEAEHALRRTIEAAMPAGIASSDLDGCQTYVNAAFCRLLGWSEAELVGARPPYVYWPPEERAAIEQAFALTLRGEAPANGFQLRFMRKDHTRITVHIMLSPLVDATGTTGGWLASVSDISQQVEAQTRLRESETRFRRLAESMPQIVWTARPDGTITYVNEHWRRVTGLTLDQTNDQGAVTQVIHPDDGPRVMAVWAERLKSGEPHEAQWRFRHRTGGPYRWFLTRAVAVRDDAGHIVEWFGTATDIDDQKRNEEALRESEERFRALADNMAQLAWIADATGAVQWYNRRWYEYTGTNIEPMRDWGWRKVQHPAHIDRVMEKYRQHIESGELWEDTFPLRGRDGEFRWFLSRAQPIRDAEGRIVRWFGTNTDITERREAEAAIEQLNRELNHYVRDLQTLLNTAPIGIAVGFDPGCQEITINPAGARMLHIPVGENMSKSRPDAERLPFKLHKNGRELAANELPMQVAARDNVEIRDLEIDLVLDDGTKRRLLEYASPLRDSEGRVRGCIGIFVDITDRLRMEEDLARTQKLESIGLLAGGIAHDFNNLLTAIFGNIELAKLYAAGHGEIQAPLTQAEQAFKRARDLTYQLLTFAKGGAPLRKTLAVGELVRECVVFATHGTKVRVDFDIAADLWPARVDAGQISQALHNLVLNAKDAMPAGGQLRIRARNCLVHEDGESALAPGRYVEIVVSDTGWGIPDEHIGKIFDPYFTTKAHGTGLGLPTAYSIISRHEGRLTVESREGTGSTFTILLPAAHGPVTETIEVKPKSKRGKGRVLLMDDEEQVRSVGKALVERLGYEVEVAANGDDAIERYAAAQTSDAPFAVVILDLTVPGAMGGQECLEHLRQLDPNVKAMVSSGYSNDPAMSRYEEFGFQGVVPKPYRLQDLSEALANLTAR